MDVSDAVKVTSHFCATVIPQVFEGIPHFLVIQYEEPGKEGYQIKFPGGCNKKKESPMETLIGEIREEIFPRVDGGISRRNVEWDSCELVRTFDKLERNQPGAVHRQHFYVVQGLKEPFRQVPVRDDDGTLLSQPFWMSINSLKVDADKGGLFYSHRQVMPDIIHHLSAESREWWEVLSDFTK